MINPEPGLSSSCLKASGDRYESASRSFSLQQIACVDQPDVVKHILQHLGLWETQKRPPPKINSPPSDYYTDEHIPPYDNVDPDYPFEAYIKFEKSGLP